MIISLIGVRCFLVAFAVSAIFFLPGIHAWVLANEERLRVENGHVSLHTQSRAARELLEELADLGDFELRVIGDLGNVGPESFEGLPIEEAIERLFKRRLESLVIRYKPDKDGERSIAWVRVFAPFPAAKARAPVPAGRDRYPPSAIVSESIGDRLPPPPPLSPTFIHMPPSPPPSLKALR